MVIKAFILSVFFRRRILRKLELTVTYDCQCTCEKCSAAQLRSTSKERLSLEEIKKVAQQAYQLGAFQVNFMGGEPLLRNDLAEIISRFKAYRTFLSISTNGALLTKHKIKELKKAGIDYIKISLDSPIPSDHDRKRGYPGLFDSVMKAVDFIQAEGLLCELTTVLTKESIESGKIWKIVELCKEKGKGIVLGFVVPAVCGRWTSRYDLLLDEKERRVISKLLKYPNVIRDTQTSMFKSQCSAGSEQVYISAYGDVLPCSIVQISFGNVRKELLQKIWSRMQNLRMFQNSKDLCLAGEDKDFISQYLKPISHIKKMPVPIEHFSKVE